MVSSSNDQLLQYLEQLISKESVVVVTSSINIFVLNSPDDYQLVLMDQLKLTNTLISPVNYHWVMSTDFLIDF